MSSPSRKLLTRECRFVFYGKDRFDKANDYHYIKERLHYDDGSAEDKLTTIKSYQRNFYVTKKGMQNHKEKKDFELLTNLVEYKSNQITLTANVAKAIGKPYLRGSLRSINESPYTYGTDITAAAMIKYEYSKRCDKFTPWSVAVFDVETDVLDDDNKIIAASLTMKSSVTVGILNSWIKSVANVEQRLDAVLKKYLSPYIESRGITFDIAYFDTEYELLAHIFKAAHRLKPDVITGWNIDYDITKIENACQRYGAPVESLLADPSIPNNRKFYNYIRSPDMKVTASGRVQPVMNYDKWNVVQCPATFAWIDAMCMYRRARTGAQELKNYKLDTVLGIELKLSKLRIEGTEEYPHGTLDWHKYMQTKRKAEYIAYNIFDCISVELLDEKTTDIAVKLPVLAGFSELSYFHKQPKRTADKMHYSALEQGYCIGTVSEDMYEDDDDLTVTRKDWIVMLPTHLNADTGLQCTQWPGHITNIRVGNADSDVTGSYPSNQIAGNVSKITTMAEFVRMPELDSDEDSMRRSLMDLLGGHVNAVTSMTHLHGLPNLTQLQRLYDQSKM